MGSVQRGMLLAVALLALRYLARHQGAAGAWGRRPPGCTCPAEPGPAVEAVDVRGLVAALDDDDLECRNRAQRDLVRLGKAVESGLRKALGEGSTEQRSRIQGALMELGREGTREDVELTGWSLLAFLGAGYSPFSKDEYDGLSFGRTVGEGLEALLSRQDGNGMFAEGASAAQAVAALALSEAVGLTGKEAYREPAQRAVDVVVANPASDARTLIWQVMALKSAELGGLTFPKAAYDQAWTRLKELRAADPGSAFLCAGAVVASILIHRTKSLVDLAGVADADPARMEMDAAYLTSMAVFQFDGPRGAMWKRYREVEKTWIVPLQVVAPGRCERGSWAAQGTAARLRIAGTAALMNEVYTR